MSFERASFEVLVIIAFDHKKISVCTAPLGSLQRYSAEILAGVWSPSPSELITGATPARRGTTATRAHLEASGILPPARHFGDDSSGAELALRVLGDR